MELKDLTVEHLQQLQGNPAWQLFMEEQALALAGYQAAIIQPTLTQDLGEVRRLQGVISEIMNRIEWIPTTLEDLKELEKEKQQPTQTEETLNGHD